MRRSVGGRVQGTGSAARRETIETREKVTAGRGVVLKTPRWQSLAASVPAATIVAPIHNATITADSSVSLPRLLGESHESKSSIVGAPRQIARTAAAATRRTLIEIEFSAAGCHRQAHQSVVEALGFGRDHAICLGAE